MTTNRGQRTVWTTPSDREVTMTRDFAAPRRLVWAAHTEPEHVKRWMLGPPGWTMPVCEIDLRVGGGWYIVWRRDVGTEMEMRGEYREVEAPERLVNTEHWGEPWPKTLNTLVLTESDGTTTMVSTMLFPSTEARDAAIETGMKDGTDVSFDRLDDLLATME